MKVCLEFLHYLLRGAIERLSQPECARYSSQGWIDWTSLAFLENVSRRVVEFLTIVVVLSPILGYYFITLIPYVYGFWARHFGVGG